MVAEETEIDDETFLFIVPSFIAGLCSDSEHNLDFMSHVLRSSCTTERWENSPRLLVVFLGCLCENEITISSCNASHQHQDSHLISFPCFLRLNRIVFIVFMNLFSSLFYFSTFFLFSSSSGYYFNSTGLLACEPFYNKPSYRILASCAFYFPTTMVLMYCYGSSFHANRFRLASTASSTFTTPAAITEKVIQNKC